MNELIFPHCYSAVLRSLQVASETGKKENVYADVHLLSRITFDNLFTFLLSLLWYTSNRCYSINENILTNGMYC
jgi:hypothetical protein